MRSAEDILTFWFADHGPDDWFAGSAAFDALIAAEFAETHAAVARGEAWHWRATPEGRLAEIIVLDQFSRQLFRRRPEAFAHDKMALALAQEMVAKGLDRRFEQPRRGFIYLPYMHAESVVVQAESVRLYEGLGDENQLSYAKAHKDTVDRFGRFPFRNAPLDRESTAEEETYMADRGDRGF